MALQDRIHGHFLASAQLKLDAAEALAPVIEQAAQAIVQCLTQGGKVLACGNGGSAADAQHFASAMINRFEQERPGLAAIALTTDTSVLTSIANDYDFSKVFSRQVRSLGMAGDMLLAISTSGNSINVVEAIHAAHERSMLVVALIGREGGAIKEILSADDIRICVDAHNTARIQEVHLLVLHCLCDGIDHLLLGTE